MAMKKKKRYDGVVYSTDPDYSYSDTEAGHLETIPPQQQTLRIRCDRLKGNKAATVIWDFVGSDEDLKSLGKHLKGKCGVGGSVKNGEIILQGDKRAQVRAELENLGYKYKNVGG